MVGWLKKIYKIDGWWMDRKNRWMVGWIEKIYEKMDGWMDKKIDGWLDGYLKNDKKDG